MRVAGLIFTAMAVGGSGSALAQSELPAPERADAATTQEQPEEVVVRGRRLTQLRSEVQLKREHAYGIFNAINSNDDFDVYCREEGRTGTRSTQRVCRAQFESRISAGAASEYMSQLFSLCQPDSSGFLDTQACMFSGPGDAAKMSAQAIEGQLPGKREQMTDEILRLARENDQFAQAILDWYEANQQYDAARKRRAD